MEFGPIFRTLVRNKTRFILISIEVALTLAIVVNCVNMVLSQRRQMLAETGIDEANIITIVSQPFAPDFRDKGYIDNARKADVELLQSLPAVKAAAAISAFPLSGSGSGTGYKPLGATINSIGTGYFESGMDVLNALGVRLIEGRNFTLDDFHEARSKNIIITKKYADKLFPDGNALGKQVQGRTAENPHTIIGICETMTSSWPNQPTAQHVTFFPDKPGDANWGLRYVVRTEPGQVDDLIKTIEGKLIALNGGRNVKLETLADVKAKTYQSNRAIITMLSVVIVLLVFVTALGIVGITSFSVTERTHHIGTRRALGARRVDILRYFLLENWIITTLGLILGVGATYGLNYALVSLVDGEKLDWRLVVAGVGILWVTGLLAALTPAARGARISPAIASRPA